MPEICKTCQPNIQFDSPASALKHHLETHSRRACQICNRPDVSRPGFAICKTCLEAFPEANQLEFYDSQIVILADRLARLRNKRGNLFIQIKNKFLKTCQDLFCDHMIPKDADCQKCADRAARHINKTPEYFRICLCENGAPDCGASNHGS